MKPFNLNLSKMKKISGDKNHSVFEHPLGHQIKIAHSALPAAQKKAVEQMPIKHFEDGGEVNVLPFDPNNSSTVYDTQDKAPPVVTSPSQLDQFLAQATGGQHGEAASPEAVQQAKNSLASGVSSAINGVTNFGKDIIATGVSDVNPYRSGQSDDDSVTGPSPASVPNVDQSQESSPPEGQASNGNPPGMTGDLSGAYQKGLNSIQEQQKVSEKEAAANAQSLQDDIQHRQDLMEDAKRNLSEYQSHADQFLNDYANNHINPNAYLENMGAGSKIATAIGLLLGGASSGVTGKNPAADFLNQQIERNIAAQRNNQDKSLNLLSANRQLYGDQQAAENQTRINMGDILNHQIQLNAAKLGTPQAKAIADAHSAQWQFEKQPLLQQNAIRSTIFKNLQQTGGRGIDAIDLAHAGIISQDQAEKEQIAVNTAKSKVAQANNLFDQLEKEQSFINLANPQSYSRVRQIAAQMVPLVQDEDPSKRLTEQSYEKEIEPFIYSTLAGQKTKLTGRQGVLNLIKTANQGKAPTMEKYAPGSLPNYNAPSMSQPVARQTADGKIALFDPQTKKFLGYQ